MGNFPAYEMFYFLSQPIPQNSKKTLFFFFESFLKVKKGAMVFWEIEFLEIFWVGEAYAASRVCCLAAPPKQFSLL